MLNLQSDWVSFHSLFFNLDWVLVHSSLTNLFLIKYTVLQFSLLLAFISFKNYPNLFDLHPCLDSSLNSELILETVSWLLIDLLSFFLVSSLDIFA